MDDIPVLVDLMEEFYAESEYPLDRDGAASSFRSLLQSPALGSTWLLDSGGVSAGYLVLTVRFSMEYGGLDGFVDDLYVRPAHRGVGLGRSGLEAVFAEAKRRGLLALHVVVGSEDTRALALYAKFGFESPRDGRLTLTTLVPAGSATA